MSKTPALLLAVLMLGAPAVQAKTCKPHHDDHPKVCRPKHHTKVCRRDDDDDHHHKKHHRHTSAYCPY